ncbi:MAG TPA: Ni/Fe-hydrogenase, b-type cytochrome subunit [Candidatus Dormibacteraeota bacterium]|nr:Ni/Fe-hydrogenase, b-type cytochrome subunit [Candidatus Dormibacteraeota bacterium]
MTTAPHSIGVKTPSGAKENLVRVYVWQWPVRIAHWLIFLSIIVLSFTGYYLYDPFIISRGDGRFLMGTMRFIHEVAAFVFITAFLLRVYWFFMGNKWARWRQFLPIGKQQRRGFVGQMEYYLFIRRRPVSRMGHNPLAAATYLFMYALMLIQILTGLALYNHILGSRVLGFFIGWLPALMSVRYLREIHFLIMFAFGAFVIHHVYSAILIGIEEGTGLVGGIFSGYKFFTESRVKEDASHHK